jgi:hypothetical protein
MLGITLLLAVPGTSVGADCGEWPVISIEGAAPTGDRATVGHVAPVPFAISEIAHHLAPVLSFSENEALLAQGRALPESILSSSAKWRVAYFMVRQIRVRQGLNPDDAARAVGDVNAVWSADGLGLPLDLLEGLTLRYFFYYSNDYGFGQSTNAAERFGAHAHDLESVEIRLTVCEVVQEDRSMVVVQMASIAGAAHGSGWYTNELVVDGPVAFPVRVLVEEGKHAMSPDRDGDGIYAPGHDVNRYSDDAWGIRDRFDLTRPPGVGPLVSKFVHYARYRDWMTAPRRERQQVWPRVNAPPHVEADHRVYDLMKAGVGSAVCGELNSASGEVEAKTGVENPVQQPLARLLESKGFCDRTTLATNSTSDVLTRLTGGAYARPYQTMSDKVGVAMRIDGGRVGLSAALPFRDVPGVGGWLVLRGNWLDETAGVDVEYRRSATWLADWYASVGLELGLAVEGGINVRLPLPSLPLLGFRIGLRTARTDLSRLRLVVGAGIGPW